MKYFKDTNGLVFAYESDGSQDQIIEQRGDEITPISESEAMALCALISATAGQQPTVD